MLTVGLLCTAGRPTSPKVRGQRLAAVAAHDLRPDWPHKVDLGEGQRHQLDNRRTDACAATENGCQQLRGWTSGGPRPSRTPSLAPRRTTTARRALPKTIYMCVRRQLRNINYEVRFTRMAISFYSHTLTRRNRSHEAVRGPVSPRETTSLKKRMRLLLAWYRNSSTLFRNLPPSCS